MKLDHIAFKCIECGAVSVFPSDKPDGQLCLKCGGYIVPIGEAAIKYGTASDKERAAVYICERCGNKTRLHFKGVPPVRVRVCDCGGKSYDIWKRPDLVKRFESNIMTTGDIASAIAQWAKSHGYEHYAVGTRELDSGEIAVEVTL